MQLSALNFGFMLQTESNHDHKALNVLKAKFCFVVV